MKKKAAANKVPAIAKSDLNHTEAEDLELHKEETVVGSRLNKKGSSTKVSKVKMQDAFWGSFEEFLKTKQKEALQRAGGWTL